VPGAAIAAALKRESGPFNLEKADAAWADEWRRVNPSHFPNGGERWSVALRTAEQPLGALVLADRVNGAPYSTEELALLQCVADHVTSALLNLRLADEVAQAREMEAFRAMSAFFVHDLKNAATSLNLTLKNLPVHFREDALRAIGNTARRIDATIARLSALRQRPDFRPIEADLNELVDSAIETLPGAPGVELTRQLQPLPAVLADPGQIQSVVTNLLLNACEAVGAGGRVRVVTERREGWATLSVTDNGCGMSPAFLKDCLFRPFQSTKKKGLGIGMFQSRQIVEAHGGTIRVDSEAGRGTSVRVSLPARNSR
jgi:putative PEP-CTERM system histidine kinase